MFSYPVETVMSSLDIRGGVLTYLNWVKNWLNEAFYWCWSSVFCLLGEIQLAWWNLQKAKTMMLNTAKTLRKRSQRRGDTCFLFGMVSTTWKEKTIRSESLQCSVSTKLLKHLKFSWQYMGSHRPTNHSAQFRVPSGWTRLPSVCCLRFHAGL